MSKKALGADHFIPGAMIVQHIMENKEFVQLLVGRNSLFMK